MAAVSTLRPSRLIAIRRLTIVLVAGSACSLAMGDYASTGVTGIKSHGLPYNGSAVTIGQVELGRPGRSFGVDTDGEWFWDANNNFQRDAGEYFVDFNADGVYNAGQRNYHSSVGGQVALRAQIQRTAGGNDFVAVPGATAPFLTGPAPGTPGGMAAPGGGVRAIPFQGVNSYMAGASYSRNDPQIEDHATSVAGVLVGQDPVGARGVAPGAALASVATGFGNTVSQGSFVLATQWAASGAGFHPTGLRVVNHSWGWGAFPALNGNALVSQASDNFSRKYDSLQVMANSQKQTNRIDPIAPADSFNGITVGRSAKDANGFFTQVSFGNLANRAPDGRSIVHIIAPGDDISAPTFNPPHTDPNAQVFGTSFAAPHVSGTVAILQHMGATKRFNNAPRFAADSQRAEVMRAVILNSADKIRDNGTFTDGAGRVIRQGFLLDMDKTITSGAMHSSAGWGGVAAPGVPDVAGIADWTQSEAYNNPALVFDRRMGAGQLNAERAVRQYDPGKYAPGNVPRIGWSFNSITNQNTQQDFIFSEMLPETSFVSITLCWDRIVTLQDSPVGSPNNNGIFDIGESFNVVGLTNLDLLLIRLNPANNQWTELGALSSTSTVDSNEHIFAQIPSDGHYGIRVKQVSANLPGFANTDYGLAWWSIPSPGVLGLAAAAGLLTARRRRAALA